MSTGDGSTPPLEDLSVGDAGPTEVYGPVDRTDFVKYIGASADFAPIHYSEPAATEAGYPTVFAPGMMTTGYAASTIAGWVGLENLKRFRTRMTAQVWPGDTLTVTSEVVEKNRSDGETRIEIEFSVTNQDEEPVVTGDATAVLSATP